jgi:trimeric autotransporter adhesin
MVVDGAGNLFIADTGNNRIRQISATTGIITTVAGNGLKGFGGDGGPATDAFLDSPQSVAVDTAGNLFIADTNNGRIRRVDAGTGSITTIAGGGASVGEGAPATDSSLLRPGGVAVDPTGNILIAETGANRVRLVDRVSGKITTVAGTGNFGFSGDGGPATAADLAVPQSVAVDKTGNLLIADTLNNRIRRVDAKTGTISTVTGGGNSLMDGQTATNAQLILPGGAVVDSSGNLLIADSGTNRIRKVDTTGIISTIAGSGMRGFSGDNRSATLANLNFPTNVAVDKEGNLYIADRGNDAVRAVKGVARTAPVLMIASASFTKPTLLVQGTGFGMSGARVFINNRDSSSLITGQSDTEIRLKGNKKKLNLKKGPNQIIVMVGATASNTFVLNVLNVVSDF